MQRRRFLAVAGWAVTAAAAGCLGSGTDSTGDGGQVIETTDVSMVGSQFDPRNVNVDAGATVTWTNDDSAAHTVTNASVNWTFDEEVAGGGSTEFTFEESGVYAVYCRFHGSADLTGMSMKVGVGDATIEQPLGGAQGSGGVY